MHTDNMKHYLTYDPTINYVSQPSFTFIEGSDINVIYNQGLDHFSKLYSDGDKHVYNTRNGRVIRSPGIFVTNYLKPSNKVLFDPQRNANPFFHFFESLWMLAGRNDVEFLEQFSKNIASYTDDGKTFNAAYGHRWRNYFGFDQLKSVIELLKKDPTTRQAILQLWSADDLNKPTRDKACNTLVKFELDEKTQDLNMTVFNRSNDMYWGTYGANVVQFSTLLEYVAASTGYRVGFYQQVSANTHLYLDLYPSVDIEELLKPQKRQITNFYDLDNEDGISRTYILDSNIQSGAMETLLASLDEITFMNSDFNFEEWVAEGEGKFKLSLNEFTNTLLVKCSVPVIAKILGAAFKLYKIGELRRAINLLDDIDFLLYDFPCDWIFACREWLTRIEYKRNNKSENI